MDITLERILSLLPRKPDGKFVRGSKKDFADSLSLPHNIVMEWESGKSRSYRNYLYEISAKYNISVEWLKGESDTKEKAASPMGDDFSRKFAMLTPQNQDLIRQMLDQLTIAQSAQE